MHNRLFRSKIIDDQSKFGITVDGVAGPETSEKRWIQCCNTTIKAFSWDNVEHFTQKEFMCPCGCGFDDINLELVKVLEQIRSHFGDNALHISSGYQMC